jgi:hypothetical protein
MSTFFPVVSFSFTSYVDLLALRRKGDRGIRTLLAMHRHGTTTQHHAKY